MTKQVGWGRPARTAGFWLATGGLCVAVWLIAGCAKYSPQHITPVPGSQTAAPAFAGASSVIEDPLSRRTQAPLGSLPSPHEEIWVISRSISDPGQPAEDLPGCGALMTRLPDEGKEIPLPLKHTDVKAAISGYIATVDVTQQFQNPFPHKIEAVYVFPLPANAAVNEFVMRIGERRIRGIIRERREAERIYQEAKAQGYVASLLTQERPNLFTQSVANLEPGRQIDVSIRYFHTLAFVDGWYEFVFPMVVGPRFNPPGSADGVGAVGRGRTGISGQPTEVQYLGSGERSGHDIAVQIDLQPGVAIEALTSRTHALSSVRHSAERATITLNPNDRIPNKDLVLRYRVAGERIKSSLLTHRDERGGFFTLMLYPPASLNQLDRQPLELVFVLDCSGSMNGRPIEQAKAAVNRALHRLRPEDSFQIITFSLSAAQLGPKPLAATPANIRRGLAYLEKLKGEGGTMMNAGIKAALDFPHDPQRLRFVAFLTDGYIGNETEIFAEIRKRLGASRIFSFGIGSSVNRFLVDGMARMGRGAVAYLGPHESAAEIMDGFLDRIAHPAMTDLRIDWGAMQVEEVYPRTIPDLFVGRPVILTGRFRGTGSATARVIGQAAGQPVEVRIPARLDDLRAAHPGLPSVWARLKIAALYDHAPDPELESLVRQTALDYSLLSPFTAFVAVDSTRRTEGDSTTVPVAVPVPEGVNRSTTVQE